MAVRIYELSKKIGMENSELIELLRDRGYLVKSASSTVDNISAESLVDEFAKKAEQSAEEGEEKEQSAAEQEEKAAGPKLPPNAIVRTREEIEKERREQEEEQRKARQQPNVVSPPQEARTPQQPPRKAPPPMVAPPSQGRRPVQRVSAPPPPPSKPAEEVKPAEKEQEEKPEEKPQEAAKAPPPASAPRQERSGPAPAVPPRSTSKPAPRAPQIKAPPKPPAPPQVSVPEKAEPEEEPEQPEKVEQPPAEEEVTAGDKPVIHVKPPIVVRDFAIQIGRKPFQLISELMEMNIFASMNQVIEEDVAKRVAEKHGFVLDIRHRGEAQPEQKKKEEPKKEDESKLMEPRPPVVCILGHVDHGKTTLLDTIRKTNVVKGEAGGITQHIGAYQIDHNDQKITFIDTPGHAAFSNMRARGARVTDIAVLVVAADDGFMPQTDEALGHAQVAKVPVIVAINKMDAPGANPDRVRRQMQERGIAPEEWGGETLCAEISALNGENIEGILDSILLQAEIMELKAVSKGDAEGVIVEAQKEIGRGSTASAIITRGTLKKGDAIVCGPVYCRVRSLVDDRGQQVKSAGPSTPVNIVGWSGPPDAGEKFHSVKNERQAKREAEENEFDIKKRQQQFEEGAAASGGKASVEDLFAAIEQTRQKVFRVVVKADVYGTAEALAHSLEQIKSDKIKLEVVDMGVGAVSRNDILMCSAAEASIVGFSVNLENGAQAFAKHHSIRIFQHNIIYELIDNVKDAMADELEPELRENKIGAAEVRQVFPLGKGFVAGCMVTEGHVHRMRSARILRKGKVVHESRIGTLKRFKEDATEVRAGYECGIALDGYNAYEPGDQIECFEIQKVKPAL